MRASATSSAAAGPMQGGWLDTLALVAAGALLLLPGLGAYPLWDPGEGRNAQAVREMAAGGGWLVPQLYGEPYYDKPTPFFWVLRGFQAVFGESEMVLRLPSTLATLATLVLLHRFALGRLGRCAAAIGGLVYSTSPEVVALGRFCNFDATLSFFLTAAVIAWLGWLDRRAGFPWHAYAAMGCGFLVKGPVAIVLPVLVLAGCALRRRIVVETLRASRPLAGALLLAAIALPWLIPAAIADPEYLRTFFLRHNVERYLSSSFDHVRGLLYFVPVLLGGFFPWSLLVPAVALFRVGTDRPAREPDRDDAAPGSAAGVEPGGDLLIWAGVIVAFFSLGQAKLATYVLPAFPPLALWVASGIVGLASIAAPRAYTLLRGATALWAVAIALLPAVVAGWLWNGFLEESSGRWPALVRGAAWSLPLPVLAGIVARTLRPEPPRPLAVALFFAAANAFLVLGFYLCVAPVVSPVVSDAEIARFARLRARDLPIVSFRIQPATLSYYSEARITRANLPEEVRAASEEGPVLIVTRRRHLPLLRDAGIPLHEWLDTRRHLLYATVPVS